MSSESAIGILIIGLVLLGILLQQLFLRSRWLPPMIVYIGLGLGLNVLFDANLFASEKARLGIHLLAEAGLVLLLFKAGIDADLKSLRKQLPNAAWIWFCNVTISALCGFLVARWLLDFDLISSLFIAIALTATSVGVAVSIWDEAKYLATDAGNLLLDVAELDDLSTIVLMAVLVAMVPMLLHGSNWDKLNLTFQLFSVVIFLLGFMFLAGLFSLYIEPRLTALIERRAFNHEGVIFLLGLGFVIAALAELAGLSLAIGAFLAGLAFSRDQRVSHEKPIIHSLSDFLVPFFFIGLGLMVDVSVLGLALLPAVLLLPAAILGKLMGVGLPALPRLGAGMALLLGVSMLPRSEIAMVVMQRGLEVGVSEQAFASMVFICVATVFIAGLWVPWLIATREGKRGK